jgi:amidophosphoribosyltransferase
MSDALKHECGIALVRLLKPLEYYKEKYGSAFYGIQKMYLLMEKQHTTVDKMVLVLQIK